MDGAGSPQGLRERLPLASSPQDVEDPVHGLLVVHPWATRPVLPLVLRWRRKESPYPLPEFVRDLILLIDAEIFLFLIIRCLRRYSKV
jgi:hypothetical protein